ncbi:conserved hypothetical protein [Pseudomonas sp. 8Z]|uniref:hypothetical protein n=1 Tax=Pseudomonas sp. 8Z TaxID=2653166 RepID=UPI0012F3AAEB|nr:hypothetical protein [Pseudomonas sp. 8Z]VXC37470.1 conserved hypothetical protein [Pseudomonas sp. 8Z]
MPLDMQTRNAVLEHPQALDGNVYRPHEQDADAEEIDLGEARVLILGPFEAPVDWDARQRDDYFAEEDPALFFSARIESLAAPASKTFFTVESGDYVAAQSSLGEVVMYYVYDHEDDAEGRRYILIRDDEEL